MANVGSIQVTALASSMQRATAFSPEFKSSLYQALAELDRRTIDPEVRSVRIIGPIGGGGGSGATISASQITGLIQAYQIGTVNAAAIQGAIDASQIGSVNAVSIQGSIDATQIGSVNAAVIQGVIVSNQIADGIIDSLNRYNSTFRPIPAFVSAPSLPDDEFPVNTFYFNQTDEKFYQNQAGVWTEVSESTAVSGSLNYYFVGNVNVSSFIGLITAAQIDTVNASSIVGTINAGQIDTIDATQITGSIVASQIGSVNGGVIQNLTITAGSIADGTITGTKIAVATIDTVNIADAAITDAKIDTLTVSKLTAGTATFTGTATFANGSFSTIISSTGISLTDGTRSVGINNSGKIILDRGSGQSVTLSSSGVGIEDSGNTLEANSVGITITGGGNTVLVNNSNIELAYSTSRVRLSSAGASFEDGTTLANVNATRVQLKKDTAVTEISAAGIQMYGGSSGIGLGASTFATSPMRITASSVLAILGSFQTEITASKVEIGDGTRFVRVTASQIEMGGGQVRINGPSGIDPLRVLANSNNAFYIDSTGAFTFFAGGAFTPSTTIRHGGILPAPQYWISNSSGFKFYLSPEVVNGSDAYKHNGQTGKTQNVTISGTTLHFSGGVLVGVS